MLSILVMVKLIRWHDCLTNPPLQFTFKNLLNFGTSLFELHIDLQINLILKMLNYFTEDIKFKLKILTLGSPNLSVKHSCVLHSTGPLA